MTFDLGFETEARKLRGEKGQGSMARRLKVFTLSDGFHVYTLASPSRAGALRTWGLARDLFKSGEAREITTGRDYGAALSRPGETIKRAATVDLEKAAAKGRRPTAPRGPSKARMARMAKLERELALLDSAHAAEIDGIERRRAELAAEAAERVAIFKAARKALEKRLAAAKAGPRP